MKLNKITSILLLSILFSVFALAQEGTEADNR